MRMRTICDGITWSRSNVDFDAKLPALPANHLHSTSSYVRTTGFCRGAVIESSGRISHERGGCGRAGLLGQLERGQR